MPGVELCGAADSGWGKVADAFRKNFRDEGDVGAAVAIYSGGKPVVDLWAGVADPATDRQWEEDTITNVFSCTKGLTATVANQLISEGLLDEELPVATWWPEFATNGKDEITLAQLLSHQAGLAAIDGTFTLDEALGWFPIVESLAVKKPDWVPGSAHGYHMRSFGWLVGEVIRRVTDKMPSEVFAEQVAKPLGMSTWIGTPREEQHRAARLLAPGPVSMPPGFTPSELAMRTFTGPSDLFHYDDMWNSAKIRSAELPSSSALSDARSLARMYAATTGEVDGVRVLSEEAARKAAITLVSGQELILGLEMAFGLGYMAPMSFTHPTGTTIGHNGAGGSSSFADLDADLGFAYVMNQMRLDDQDTRADHLVEALYRIVG